MNTFWLTIYTNWNEYPMLESTDKIENFQFETILPGGFGVASFSVSLTLTRAVYWYSNYIGRHVVIFDAYGTRVYEGRINTISIDREKVSVDVTGWYAAASDLTHGIIYPTTTAKSASDLIIDCVDLITVWDDQGYYYIEETTTDITPQDFTGETKVNDAIEEILKFGDDGTPPRKMHFVIYENRVPQFFSEPILFSDPDWLLSTKNMQTSGNTLTLSLSDLYNKIQVLYEDKWAGQTFTSWGNDTDSQDRFGIREGSVNIGSSVSTVATVVRDLALEAYAYPTQKNSVSVSGTAKTQLQVESPLYLIRAGSTVRVVDYEDAIEAALIEGKYDKAKAFITRTRYNASNNTLSLEFGSQSIYMDILMTRLGLSSGSVK